MARINFRQGIVRTHAIAMQFVSGNTAISLDGQTAPIVLNFADGPNKDYLWEEAKLVNPAWTNLPSANKYWLYIDIDPMTSVRTFGTTVYQPLVQTNTPASPSVDQHWFDTRSSYTIMKVWSGSRWVEKIRVFMAQVNGLTINAYATGTQVGLNDTVYAGRILYDDENKIQPIKSYDIRGRGKFITTETPIFSQFSNITGYKIAQAIVEGKAIENIAEHYAVAFRGTVDGEIGLAKNGTASAAPRGPYPAVGVSTESYVTGETHTFVTSGYLTDDNWSWPDDPGTFIFVGVQGELTTTPPQSGSIQRIGYVVSDTTILIDIQPMITYG